MTIAVLDVVSDDANIPLAQIQTDTGVSSYIYAKRVSSNESYYLLLGSKVLSSSDEGVFSIDTATIAEKLGSFEYFTVTDLYLGLASTISSSCYGIWISQQFSTTISNSITIRPNDTNTKHIFIQCNNSGSSSSLEATAYMKDGTTKYTCSELYTVPDELGEYQTLYIARNSIYSTIYTVCLNKWTSIQLASTFSDPDTPALFLNTNIEDIEKIEISEGNYGNVFAFHEEKNTTLEPGQLGVEYTDSGKPRLKVGDGTSTKDWSELSYLENPSISTTTTTTGTSGGSRYTDTTLTNEFSLVNSNGVTTETGDIGLELKTETYSSNSTLYPKVSVSPYNTFDETGVTLGSEDKPFEELYVKGISLDEDTYISSNGSGKLNIEQGNGGVYLNTTSTYTSLYPNSETVSNYLGTSSMPWDTGYINTINSNKLQFVTHQTSGDFTSRITYEHDPSTPSVKTIICNNIDTNSGNTDWYQNDSLFIETNPTLRTLYVYPSEGDGTSSYLGKPGHWWYTAYINEIETVTVRASYGLYTSNVSTDYLLSSGFSYILTDNLYPVATSTSTTTGYTLGSASYKWRYLYAYSGTIQTSDRSAKSDIKYLSNNEVATMSADSDTDSTNITMNDVVDFVKELEPATFCYKDGNGDNPTEAESSPEMIQLGLIADDICDSKLFKYVGVETEADDIIEPEEIDEETGEVIKEAVIADEKKTVRGLQAIPLATAALTCCKYLLAEIENLKEELEELKA